MWHVREVNQNHEGFVTVPVCESVVYVLCLHSVVCVSKYMQFRVNCVDIVGEV